MGFFKPQRCPALSLVNERGEERAPRFWDWDSGGRWVVVVLTDCIRVEIFTADDADDADVMGSYMAWVAGF